MSLLTLRIPLAEEVVPRLYIGGPVVLVDVAQLVTRAVLKRAASLLLRAQITTSSQAVHSLTLDLTHARDIPLRQYVPIRAGCLLLPHGDGDVQEEGDHIAGQHSNPNC